MGEFVGTTQLTEAQASKTLPLLGAARSILTASATTAQVGNLPSERQ